MGAVVFSIVPFILLTDYGFIIWIVVVILSVITGGVASHYSDRGKRIRQLDKEIKQLKREIKVLKNSIR